MLHFTVLLVTGCQGNLRMFWFGTWNLAIRNQTLFDKNAINVKQSYGSSFDNALVLSSFSGSLL